MQAGGGKSKSRGAFFRVIKFTRSLVGAKRMVRYIAFRSRELEEDTKGAFDKDRDHADVKRFCDRLEDPKTKHRQAAKAYHCLFSLPREEYDRCGLQDWKEVVRDTLATYERSRNRRLDWIAAEHRDSKHPHCHVVIKAVYETLDGRHRRQLRLSRADIKEIRDLVGQDLTRRRDVHRAMFPEPVRHDPRQAGVGIDTGRILVWLLEEIRKERRQRERENEEAHQRWLRDGR